MVARWRDSGESMAAFGRKHKVPPRMVRYWVVREGVSGAKGNETGDFFVLSKPAAVVASPPEGSAERASSPPGETNAIIVVVPLCGNADVLAQALRSVLQAARR